MSSTPPHPEKGPASDRAEGDATAILSMAQMGLSKVPAPPPPQQPALDHEDRPPMWTLKTSAEVERPPSWTAKTTPVPVPAISLETNPALKAAPAPTVMMPAMAAAEPPAWQPPPLPRPAASVSTIDPAAPPDFKEAKTSPLATSDGTAPAPAAAHAHAPAAGSPKPISGSSLPSLGHDPTIPRFEDFTKYEIHPESAQLLPREFCEKFYCCIVGKIPSDPKASVAVAMVDPRDEVALGEIVALIGRRLHPIQFNAYEVKLAIDRAFGTEPATTRSYPVALDHGRRIDFAPSQTPQAMLDDLLSVALQYGASDVHIETYLKDVDLRFRKGGVLKQVPTPLAPDNVKGVIARVKTLCKLDPAAKPQAVEGRFSARYRGDDGDVRTVHFRASIVPSPRGEDCVLRIMDPLVTRRSLDELGMAPASLQALRTLLRCPSGLILVTGPTGSGTTTTLYGALRDVHGELRKVCTVEDPIEYLLPKVNQFQVEDDLGFAPFARALVRQDPDVIMIGEIRDPDTAQVAVRAASTGHLVLSTVPTEDAVAAVTRMRMLGVEDELLSGTLLGVTAQRLVRRSCVACKTGYQPTADAVARFYKEPPKHAFLRGKGCKACSGTGFTGQFGIFEVFVCDEAMASAIGSHATLVEIRTRAKERGFVPLVDQALERVRAGETTLEEVERTVRPVYLR